MSERAQGHLAALITIVIWGTTFISTKILLVAFQPVEILFLRFVIGFLTLWVIHPKRMKKVLPGQKRYFIAAGFCGICLYYLLENIALTYTAASNVGIIISIAPFFTAMLSSIVMKSAQLHRNFILGFVCAMIGIILIGVQGRTLALNPFGDFLAVIAALVWACYSILTKKISTFGIPTLESTRLIFFYGLLWMVPALCFFTFQPDFTALTQPVILANLLFLGFGASALCFVTWNSALKLLGAVQTSVYIYMVPVITVVTSMLVLQEQLTMLAGVGILFTMCGLWVSQIQPSKKGRMILWIKQKNVSSS